MHFVKLPAHNNSLSVELFVSPKGYETTGDGGERGRCGGASGDPLANIKLSPKLVRRRDDLISARTI